jgi:hypothetical protein
MSLFHLAIFLMIALCDQVRLIRALQQGIQAQRHYAHFLKILLMVLKLQKIQVRSQSHLRNTNLGFDNLNRLHHLHNQ